MSSQSARSVTVLVVAAHTPEAIDAMDWDARREHASSSIAVVHAGEPDRLFCRSLALDALVYRLPREWDESDSAVVETSLLAGDALDHAIYLVDEHVARPETFAEILVREVGSGEDPARVARAFRELPAEPAQGPAEEAAAFVRSFHAHAAEAVRRGMAVAWECRTPAPCACAVWEGTIEAGSTNATAGNNTARGEVRGVPRSQFVTIASDETAPSRRTGRLRCMRCRATFTFVATTTYTFLTREPPRPTLELGADEIDRVIAGIRDGAQVVVGGSRLHTTYFGRDGELFVEDFDEGATEERTCSEAELRATIAAGPSEFLEVLRRPLRDVLQRALVGASQVSPLAALRDLLVYGECFRRRYLLEAVIVALDADPQARPMRETLSEEAKTELASLHDGCDVYHFIREVMGYGAGTPATGRFALRVFEVLAEMLGRELPYWRRYRSEFRAMAGDATGALDDLEWERKRLPSDDRERPYVERAIAKLVDAQLLAQIAASPDDDAPRLVFADILAERGDPRGEFIVAQCRLARLDEDDPERASLLTRSFHLIALHGRAWGKRGYAYDRGFVESIEVRWTTFAADLDEAFALSPPVQGLRYRTYRGDWMADPERALDDPRLDRITALDFTMPVFELDGPDDETVHPFGSAIVRRIAGRFAGLRELTIRGTPLSIDEVARIGPRPALRTLDLGEVPLRGAVDALVGSGRGRFDELRVLRLANCELDDDDVAAFGKLPALAELDLRACSIGERAARALASQRLAVRSLLLGETAIGDDGVGALCAAPFASELVRLDVEQAGVGNAGVARIAELPLSCLLLESNPFDETAMVALANGRVANTLQRLSIGPIGQRRLAGTAVRVLAGMPRLWQLLLRRCALDGSDVVAMLDGLPALRAIALGHCAIDDAGLAKLVAHPAFARLDVLELANNQLGPDAGRILARAPRLPARLFLNGNRLGDAGARALAEAPVAARVADLILQDNAITKEGALALVGESSQLVATVGKLCLHDNAIGDDAARVCFEKLGPRFCFPATR